VLRSGYSLPGIPLFLFKFVTYIVKFKGMYL